VIVGHTASAYNFFSVLDEGNLQHKNDNERNDHLYDKYREVIGPIAKEYPSKQDNSEYADDDPLDGSQCVVLFHQFTVR
jgi:hypothetical protein